MWGQSSGLRSNGMAPLDDSTKAKLANLLTQAAVAGSATAMVAGPVEAFVASVAGGGAALAGFFIDKVAARDTRLAAELIENMIMADDEPVELVVLLAEKLHDGDEEMLIKVRAVMRADLEAASPAALPPIARIGREYIRGCLPSWVARGWLRVLSEASTREIDALRELARISVDCLAAGADVYRELHVGQLGVTVLLTAPVSEVPGHRPASQACLQVWPQWSNFGLRAGRPDREIAPLVTSDAPRVFDLMTQHGVASNRSDLVAQVQVQDPNETRPATRMTDEAARALVSALGIVA